MVLDPNRIRPLDSPLCTPDHERWGWGGCAHGSGVQCCLITLHTGMGWSPPRPTLFFILPTSLGVRVSALARTGTMFTRWCRAFMNSMSRGRSLPGTQQGEADTMTLQRTQAKEMGPSPSPPTPASLEGVG